MKKQISISYFRPSLGSIYSTDVFLVVFLFPFSFFFCSFFEPLGQTSPSGFSGQNCPHIDGTF